MNTRLTCEYESISHDDLASFMQALAYKSGRGICTGYNGAVLPGLFLDAIDRINLRFCWMATLLHYAKRTSTSLPDVLKAISHDHIAVSPEEKEIISGIPAFCEALEFHYQPELYPEWFPPHLAPKQSNIIATLPYFIPDILKPKVDCIDGDYQFGKSKIELNALTEVEVEQFLDCIKTAMEKHRIPLAIQISSSTHTGLVSYSLEHKHWIIADSQLILLETYDSESPAKDLINCFTDKSHIVMSWQFIGLKQQEVDTISTELMANPTWKNLITLTPEKAYLPGHYGDYLAHLAAQNDTVATMQNIMTIAPETVSKPIFLIGSPLYQAVLADQKVMVEWLLSHDKNIKNHIEAFWGSIHHRKLDMLTCLLEHGILKHIDVIIRDPLFEVYVTSPRNMAMTEQLLKHGAKVTSTFLLSLQIKNDSNTHMFENHQKALLSQSLFRPASSDTIKSDHTQAHGQTIITLTSSSIN